MNTAPSLKERSLKLVDEGRLTEAFPLLKKVVQETPNDVNLWNSLAWTALQLQRFDEAIEAYKQSIRITPQSVWTWTLLAKAYLDSDRLDDAENTLTNARSLNTRTPWLWRYYAELYRKQKNIPKEIESLEKIHESGEASGYDLNMLGIAYYNHGNYAKAVYFYRLSAEKLKDSTPLFNMGLVFNNPEVSQDVDATDAYRRALVFNPDHQRAKEQLEATRHKLVLLSDLAKAAARDLIQPAEYFQFYLNPFDMLQIEFGELSDDESYDEIDIKVIQRAKKRLLQEIDLNDGKVSWLGDHSFDKSRALALENELYDNHKRLYHRAIFQNSRLLRFLTSGDIDHFLYTDDYFPKETIELLEKEPEFLSFLSKPFAQQYNLLISRALERKTLSVVEVLFDGRRWVLPEDDDVCFEGANKQVNYLVNLLQAEVSKGEKEKPSLQALETFLNQHALPDIFNLLPASFMSAQTDIVAELRSLAISCYNNHGDTDLSQSVLNLCKLFHFKSTELNKRLEDDFKTIAEKIAEERKYEAKLVFGEDHSFEITKEGIRDGKKFLTASSINKMRWGITKYTGAGKYDYIFVITDDAGETIKASWCASDKREANSTKHFNSIVQATLSYLADAVIGKMQAILQRGQSVVIGPCTLTKEGIKFKTQCLFFKKNQFIKWYEVSAEMRNGQVIVCKTSQPKVATTMSKRETDNAVLLPIFTLIMQDKKP